MLEKPGPWEAFYLVGIRPVRVAKDESGELSSHILDWETGEFLTNVSYVDWIYFSHNRDIQELSKDLFDEKVQQLQSKCHPGWQPEKDVNPQDIRLDIELERIFKQMDFLWEPHGCHLAYFTRSYGMYHRGFLIGLKHEACKFLFEHETGSRRDTITCYVGKKDALFRPPGDNLSASTGWYSVSDIVYWISGVEREYVKDIDQDLEFLGSYVKNFINEVFDLFRDSAHFDHRLDDYRTRFKGRQITVGQIRAERARLQSLGQDSSLETAILNLRKGTS